MSEAYQEQRLNDINADRIEQDNILKSKEFLVATGKINIPLGRTDDGKIIVKDLCGIPHILVCGTTGSGKTTFVQTMVAVVCNSTNPNDVKLVIYDSKGVDYTPFENVPHLLEPLITWRREAVSEISELVSESQNRFRMFAELGCRDLNGYNMKCSERNKLPEILFVVDDFAELRLDRNEQNAFNNILKNGRIAGIHVIVVSSIGATRVLQKDLISNIPCRIAFKLTSKTESRNVIESYGAETLNVPGEMLYKFLGDYYKLQCAHADFENIEHVMKNGGRALPKISELGKIAADIFADESIIDKKENNNVKASEIDKQVIEAGFFAIYQGKTSIEDIQKSFKTSYVKAVKIMDELEKYGVVGPELGTGQRQIRMSENEWEDKCLSLGTAVGNVNKGEAKPNSGRDGGSAIKELVEDDSEPNIELRDFEKFEVGGTELSVSNHVIKYKKPIMTTLGAGTIYPELTGNIITHILYKRPSAFSMGYFTFKIKDGTKIINQMPHLLHVDKYNVSEVIKVEFGTGSDKTVQRFLNQISEDIGIPITRV